jgi:hypothetical protein
LFIIVNGRFCRRRGCKLLIPPPFSNWAPILELGALSRPLPAGRDGITSTDYANMPVCENRA